MRSITLALLLAVLSGCGGANQPEGRSVALWHIQTVGEGPEIIQQSVDRFKMDNPGVNVEVVPINNDAYKTKIKVAVGAGNAPCVFPTWGGGPLREYVKAGQVLDLTPYMSANNYKDRFLDAAMPGVTFDGKVWGVPVENVSLAVVFYNKALFAKHHLTPPRTYDELLKLVHALKDKGIAPFALANKPKWPGSMFFMYLVDRLDGPDTFAKAAAREGATFEAPVFIEAGKRVQDLVKAGAFQDGFNGLDYDSGGMRALLYSEKAAMELMGTWEIGTIKSENPDFYENKLGFFPFPALPDGKGDPNDIVGTVGNNFYSVAATCKDPDDAFKLIQYLIDDTAVVARGKSGRIPPIKGFQTGDPVLQAVMTLVEKAPNVQLWYDQYLPPSVAEAHKDTSQSLFSLSMTPEEAARQFEQAAKDFYKQ
ncbi:MAG TPA: extracellular solute-binding protein [Terriglobia bacterium]|nr:extracellular solute-binding protein [Terriglobia bacterium]